jgi:hypothetical protein
MFMSVLLLEPIVVQIVSVIVFYMVVLQYRLPFSQVALTVALVSVLSAIVARLMIPNPNKVITQRQALQSLSSVLAMGFADIVVGLIATIATIYIALYRFGGMEIVSLLVISWLSSFVSNIVLKVL